MEHIADLISLKVWHSIDELDTTIQTALFDRYLTDLLSNYNEKSQVDRETALSYISGKVNQLTSLNPYVEAADFYFYNGDQLVSPSSMSIEHVFYSPYFFVNHLNQKLDWIGFDYELTTINGSKIVMDSSGRAIALMVVKVNQTFLSNALNEKNLTDQFTFHLINKDKYVLLSTNRDYPGTRWYPIEQRGYILTAKEVPVLRWKLYLQIPNTTFTTYINEYGKSQIVLISFILLFGLLTSIAMALSISRPIKLLIKQMRKIAADDIYKPEFSFMQNELAILEKTFYLMVRRVDELINNVYRETIFRRESELKALQAQLNPHFLFNVLDLLNWKALMSNNKEISEIVQSLARLIEVNLQTGEKTITLEREMSYVRDYFSIMSKKFGNKIILDANMDSAVLRCHIPKLLLQPLVENAIKHGFEYINQGRIVIEAMVNRGNLEIRIRDNGRGMSEDRRNEVMEIVSASEPQSINNMFISQEGLRESVGISNTNRRLKILHNNQCTFSLQSEEGVGTEIYIMLPAIEEEFDV